VKIYFGFTESKDVNKLEVEFVNPCANLNYNIRKSVSSIVQLVSSYNFLFNTKLKKCGLRNFQTLFLQNTPVSHVNFSRYKPFECFFFSLPVMVTRFGRSVSK